MPVGMARCDLHMELSYPASYHVVAPPGKLNQTSISVHNEHMRI